MKFDASKIIKPTVSPEDMARVKGLGCLWDKTSPNCFNCRVITRNGKITADEVNAIAEAARCFGNGEVAFTSRLTVEIQKVPFQNIEPMRAFLLSHGLETGGTGPKVRPIVSCKGTTCQFGLIDTFGLSLKIHERFYKGYHDVKLPHKFKIAVGGCPNNCVKPDINDIGIIGQRIPEPIEGKCRDCKLCEKTCPMKAIKVTNGVLEIDEELCNNCGRCVKKCGALAIDCTDGYKMTIGGRWGKKTARGQAIGKIFTSEEQVLNAVEKAILFFREEGANGERFSDTIERVGFEKAEKTIVSDDIMLRKDEILEKSL